MSNKSTVASQKTDFLIGKRKILSAGFSPSDTIYDIALNGGIQEKVLDDVLRKVNRDIKKHSRLAYSTQSINSVVEQIDDLYWVAGAATLDQNSETTTDVGGDDADTLYQGDDLTLDKNISKLPPTWDTSADPDDEEEGVSQDDYMTAVTRLQDLSAKRLTVEQKLNTFRTLLSLLEPYRNPQENVQPNIVTQKGPLGQDLMKTKTLAIRVAGRVNEKFGNVQVAATAEEDEGEDVEMGGDDGKSKLGQILEGW
ncbi:kinetochore Sim4 complex subunit Fta4 [Clohesyomyces aquaticus]|uniref:Kinetochore Sim4 complex subunit Fta4 n=1 Tax=Clohesyomyces aquaticus TaxID=1231657 RepID=A0A1Y1Y374_9PLEO|nr:kinetochore Sim4 complex subunit Fta4 [Clohesyomyces aquaticus]